MNDITEGKMVNKCKYYGWENCPNSEHSQSSVLKMHCAAQRLASIESATECSVVYAKY